jgi:Family of unknown function (DUF5825)
LPSGDRTRAAGPADLELGEQEGALDLDVGAAVRGGARGVRVTEQCRLSPGAPRAALAMVRLLREAGSYGVPVSWTGEIDGEIDARLLVHLAPPELSAGNRADAALTEWRERHQPGLCYYRLGPDFVFIKDVRRADASARFRLDGVVAAFHLLEAVVDMAALDPAAQGIANDLESEGLFLRLGGMGTLLPTRMRRWPVPALEV